MCPAEAVTSKTNSIAAAAKTAGDGKTPGGPAAKATAGAASGGVTPSEPIEKIVINSDDDDIDDDDDSVASMD